MGYSSVTDSMGEKDFLRRVTKGSCSFVLLISGGFLGVFFLSFVFLSNLFAALLLKDFIFS